jgi:preprotein translocase subunit SecE
VINRFIKSIRDFLTDVRSELMKVNYPSRQETTGSTTVVIIFSLIVSIFLYVVDLALIRLLRWII